MYGSRVLNTLMITFVLFTISMVGYGVFYLYEDKEVDAKKDYILATVVNVNTVIENHVSDQKSDFFAITNEDKALYITVNGEDGNYTYESKEITGDGSLNDMKVTSIERENKPVERRTSIMPIFIPR